MSEQLKAHTIIMISIIALLMSCVQKDFIKTDEWSSEFVKDTSIHQIDFTFIPGGPFKNGPHCEQDSITYDYWIGKYEVTNAQFHRFLTDALRDKYLTIENNILYYPYEGDDVVSQGNYRVKMFDERIFLRNDSLILHPDFVHHPVISVTWYGSLAFCRYYGFDLPTENEWVKAARGNQCLWYPWGNYIDSTYANYFSTDFRQSSGTTPVGFYNGRNQNGFLTSKAESVYGCYDMAGNAWEWTKDRFTPEQPYTMGKGGGYNIHTPAQLQIYYVSTFGVLDESPAADLTHLPDGFRVIKRIDR